ncbi:MAG: hypothetical protein ABI353_18345, partial [Isosphaeraceae bacterium]
QVIRWSLRPTDDRNLNLSVRREGGQIKIVVDALDKSGEFLNFLQIVGNVSKPDLTNQAVELVQTAPGRYEATVDGAEARGNYFVNLAALGADKSRSVLSTGISVPYSDEYRELKSNPATLETIASLTDGQVLSWKYRHDGEPDVPRTLDQADVFRRDPKLKPPESFQDLWPNLLWLAAVLFLADVAVRRVSPDFARMRKLVRDHWEKIRGHEVAPPVEYMEKLRSRKAEVGEQLQQQGRAAAQFEPPTLPGSSDIGEPLLGGSTSPGPRPEPKKPQSGGLAPESKPAEPESYTNRLLRAKKKVWEEREKDKDKDSP